MSEPLPALLYVEDDPDIAEMTVEVLSDAYRVDHVVDGEEALQRALRNRYDVMVVDRRLPGRDGASLVEAIRTARITTPVLLLTALGTVPDRVEGLDAGANDYLTKPFDYDELLARLRALRRGFQAEGRRREIGDWIYVPDSSSVHSPSGGRMSLTATENALLELLSASPERVFSRDEIMRAVFSSADAEGAVDTYVHYIRRKTTPEMIETVRGRGYRLGMPT